jgi:hypothetical protein
MTEGDGLGATDGDGLGAVLSGLSLELFWFDPLSLFWLLSTLELLSLQQFPPPWSSTSAEA